MIVAMCLSMLAKPVFEDCTRFFKLVEKCAVLRNSTVKFYYIKLFYQMPFDFNSYHNIFSLAGAIIR